MAIYGYARCSTNEARQDITRQVRELIALGCTEKTIYKEYESGSRQDKPEFIKLQNIILPGDTLIALEVSRITRSTKQLCNIVDFAHEKQIKLIMGSIVIDCTTNTPDPFSEAVLKIFGVIAELEREMTRMRVRSGLENARAKGKTLGRRKTNVETISQAFLRYYKQYCNGEISITELSKLATVSRTTAYKYKRILSETAAL